MNNESSNLYLYPFWIRVWHGINALLFLTMIITGISMQYASPASHSWLSFDLAVRIHNIGGIALTINYIFFFIRNFLSGNFNMYKFDHKSIWEQLKIQFRYYTYGIFRNDLPPFPVNEYQKFNPLQKFTYAIIMYAIVPVIILTGWGLLFPQLLMNKILGFPGLFVNDIFHVILGYLASMFMLIHIYFCTVGATFWSNFKSIIDGWHRAH